MCHGQQTGMGQTHQISVGAPEIERLQKLFSIHILYQVINRLATVLTHINSFLTSSVPCIGLPSVSSFNPPLSYK